MEEKSDGETSKGSPQDVEEQSHHSASAGCQTHDGYRGREEAAEPKACLIGVSAIVLGGQAVDQCAGAARVGTG